MAVEGIRVHGGDEVAADFRASADDIKDLVADANRKAAEEAADAARSKASSLGGVAGKSAPAVDVEEEGDSAQLVVDGNAYPYALGAEAGASQYPQFKAYQGPEGGYFAAPAADDIENRLEDIYGEAIDDAFRRNNL